MLHEGIIAHEAFTWLNAGWSITCLLENMESVKNGDFVIFESDTTGERIATKVVDIMVAIDDNEMLKTTTSLRCLVATGRIDIKCLSGKATMPATRRCMSRIEMKRATIVPECSEELYWVLML